MRTWKMLLMAAALCAAGSAAHATALVVDSATGKLTGATDVKVFDKFYDVRFVDGSCAAVFGGCDQVSDFTFRDYSMAMIAGQALLDDVLIDVPNVGAFDTVPAQTFGCSADDYCWVMTPYATSFGDVTVTEATNRTADAEAHGLYDYVRLGDMYMTTVDFSNSPHQVWAVWTLAATDPPVGGVPEPGTASLLALALGTLALRRRR